MKELPRGGALYWLAACVLLVIGLLTFMSQDKGCRGDRVYESAFASKVPTEEAASQEINSCIDSRRWMVGIASVAGVLATAGAVVAARRVLARP